MKQEKNSVENRHQQMLKNQAPPPKKLTNVLQSDATFMGSVISGKYMLATLILISVVLRLIDWEGLYNNPSYFYFVQWMANIYPNIHSIPKTENQFPEYAMGLVAFCGFIGPFIVVYYLTYGFFHAKRINLDIIAEIPFKKKCYLGFGIFFSLLLMAAGLFIWDGDSFHLPHLFHTSKFAFVGVTVGLWWSVAFWGFGCVGMLTSFWLVKHRS
jgi:hypothetical protein